MSSLACIPPDPHPDLFRLKSGPRWVTKLWATNYIRICIDELKSGHEWRGQKRIYVEQREDGARRTISKEPRDPLVSLYRTEGLGDTYINTSGKANSEDGQLCAEQQENDDKHSKF
ncbi:hypothetical protein PGT21_007535 [Puccinia graminis f. sp. tritici]|uniref:Uncharacterized protein n=1 Tax=Puccinia graminis f. sp. tritici TaxID=56615 RepID=A0A5B0QVV0_PUCGR|nr:hypothetical protein PGT21_007535 [Puccinia graminis f. sp. tritici]KAA1120511.1 hypothetical protein PGTUg99_009290 [Puccinia graminis f. sp. tritici]